MRPCLALSVDNDSARSQQISESVENISLVNDDSFVLVNEELNRQSSAVSGQSSAVSDQSEVEVLNPSLFLILFNFFLLDIL